MVEVAPSILPQLVNQCYEITSFFKKKKKKNHWRIKQNDVLFNLCCYKYKWLKDLRLHKLIPLLENDIEINGFGCPESCSAPHLLFLFPKAYKQTRAYK